jgi:hypothetical protein
MKIRKFAGADRDQDFCQWLNDNPTGFYLNERTKHSVMLHRVGCSHLGDGSEVNTTKNFKVASQEIEPLQQWANLHEFELTNCCTCKPSIT